MTIAAPEDVGFDADRWKRVDRLLQDLAARGELPAAGLIAGTYDACLPPLVAGRTRLAADAPPLRSDAIFLIASITKPIVATAVVQLVERGLITLADRVTDYIPEFGQEGKSGVTLRHLLTHTSGLPDMLPNNRELRQGQSPLETFVAETCRIPLSFPPGRGVQYSSMGFAILGEILTRVTGQTCAARLQSEIFEPLGMTDTALGAPPEWFTGSKPKVDRIPESQLPEEMWDAETWHWNSRYWRTLGAPWGGLLTTLKDLARFAQMLLNGGELDGASILSPAAVQAATSNQLTGLRELAPDDRQLRPWGFGWRLHWPAHSANFGDLLGPNTFGHWGATGTLFWIDPDAETFCILLTTLPQEPHGRVLARISNAVTAAQL